MLKKLLLTSAAVALTASSAFANVADGIDGNNNDGNVVKIIDNSADAVNSNSGNSFASNGSVNASALSASIAANETTFTFDNAGSATYEGNTVGQNAFLDATGVAIANQNSAIGANNQQSISVVADF